MCFNPSLGINRDTWAEVSMPRGTFIHKNILAVATVLWVKASMMSCRVLGYLVISATLKTSLRHISSAEWHHHIELITRWNPLQLESSPFLNLTVFWLYANTYRRALAQGNPNIRGSITALSSFQRSSSRDWGMLKAYSGTFSNIRMSWIRDISW